MRKYKRKREIIEAEQWFKVGDVKEANVGAFNVAYTRRSAICYTCKKKLSEHGEIETSDGWLLVCPGDWIIKGITGEFYPKNPEIFEMTYEPLK